MPKCKSVSLLYAVVEKKLSGVALPGGCLRKRTVFKVEQTQNRHSG